MKKSLLLLAMLAATQAHATPAQEGVASQQGQTLSRVQLQGGGQLRERGGEPDPYLQPRRYC